MSDVLDFAARAAAADASSPAGAFSGLGALIADSLRLLRRVLALYGPSAPGAATRLALSFNGGKDSTVVLHLLRAAASSSGASGSLGGVRAVYFAPPPSAANFPAVLDFMAACEASWGFATEQLPGFRAGLAALVDGGVAAVLMGTRSSDPDGGALEHCTPTSEGWPPAMRICPILTWRYEHVWAFLRGAGLEACPLYRAGYTSLGAVDDSLPNPALRRGEDSFAPAWELRDGSLERLGRAGGAANSPPATAALIIVADEILCGRVRDQNVAFLCASLAARGVAVAEVAIVRDDVGSIAAAVARLAGEHAFVITSGGLGPTIDDVTMRGVAAAFALPMRVSGALWRVLRAMAAAGPAAGAAATATAPDATCVQRMAELPASHDCALHWPDGSREPAFPDLAGGAADDAGESGSDGATLSLRGYPLVSIANVFTLPGVPAVVRRKFAAHASLFPSAPHAGAAFDVDAGEAHIAGLLETVAREHASVRWGSYPQEEIALDSQAATAAAAAAGAAAGAARVEGHLSAIGEGGHAAVDAAALTFDAALTKAGVPHARRG